MPTRALPRHACEYRRRCAAARPAKTQASLVGSERVRRHPHRRARSGPQSGVSCGPRAYRVRVPIGSAGWLFSLGRFDRVHLGNGLKLRQELRTRLHQIPHHARVPEKLADVAAEHGKLEMVLAIGVLDLGDPSLKPGKLLFHPSDRLRRHALDAFGLVRLDQLRLRSPGEDRRDIGYRVVVGVHHELGGFDLAQGGHLAQRGEHGRGAGLVLQDRHGFWANAVEQLDPTLDAARVEIQRRRDLFLRDTALYCFQDHPVLLNRCDAADALVVGECLVVGRY